jgi:Putative zinc-finger
VTSPTASSHAWLPRLSDYHSGGVSAAERIAVEAHLATCAECQEALVMYRRFYTLLRSPLRLGGPSAHFDEPTTILDAGPSRSQPGWRSGGAPPRDPRKRRALAGIAAVLAAVLVIAGFVAVFAPRLHPPTVASTPTGQPSVTPQPTSTAEPTASPQPTGTPQPSAFVCANPQGSSLTYAYLRGDGNVYAVTGCNAPRQLTSTYANPVAWSPSNRYLAVWVQTYPAPDTVEVIDTQTGATIATRYAIDFGREPSIGSTAHIFFGWLDDNTFLGAIAPLVAGTPPANVDAPGTSTLVRVDLRTGKETSIGTIPGWVTFSPGPQPGGRIVANGHYLFYAAYQGSTAYLHRFDLTAGTDTRLVSLGLYGNDGCQGSTICGWTAPWDVSSDGSHILYHSPGAASTPSDINIPKDTPVLYANPDGSGASIPFGTQLAASLVTPVFSPNGALTVTSGSTYASTDPFSGMPQMKLVTFGGGSATIVTGALGSWRGDNQALVVFGAQSSPALYDLSSGKTTPLEANSNFYLWGH